MNLVTKTIEVEESRRNQKKDKDAENDYNQPRLVKRAKLLITLKRSKDFFENMKKFNEIKDENDKYIKAENAEREKNEAKWAIDQLNQSLFMNLLFLSQQN